MRTEKLCFKPAWWLPNRHLQTIWPTLHRRHKPLLRRERLELADGDFLDLDWMEHTDANQHEVIVLMLHGLSGNAYSPYIANTLQAITAAQWCGVVMNFRGCSGEINRLPRCNHAGDTEDLHTVIKTLRARYPNQKLAIIGFSFGGSILLKYLGESSNTQDIAAAVAVSVPFELYKAAQFFNRGTARFYQKIILSNLKELMLQKLAKLDMPFSRKTLLSAKNIIEYDENITAPMAGFKSAIDYYSLSSCRQYLKNITTATLLLHALDDPLMPQDIIPNATDLSKSITLDVTACGGHVGFITGKVPWRPQYWFAERSIHYLRQQLSL